MSDTTTAAPAAPEAAPAAPPAAAPVAAPAAVPVAVAPVIASAPAGAAPPAVEPEPAWAQARIERAKAAGRAEVLSQIGATDPAQAKAAIEAQRAAEDAKKTAEQRAAEATALAQTTQQSVARQASLIKEQAGRMLMALTTEQQKTVTDFAGDDAELQLKTILHFAPTWATQAPAPVTPIPASTSPAPTAPSGAGPASPPDARAIYQKAQQTNPFAAAAYGLANPQVYNNGN